MEFSFKMPVAGEPDHLRLMKAQIAACEGQMWDFKAHLQAQITQIAEQAKDLASLRSQLQLSRKQSATLLKMRKQELREMEFLERRLEDVEEIAYDYRFRSEPSEDDLYSEVEQLDILLGSGIFTIQEEAEGDVDDHRSDGRRSNSSRGTGKSVKSGATRDKPEPFDRAEDPVKCPGSGRKWGKHSDQSQRSGAGGAVRRLFLSVLAGHVMHKSKAA